MSGAQRHEESIGYQQALDDDYYRLFDVIQARLALTLDDHRIADLQRISDELVPSRHIVHFRRFIEALREEPITHPIWQAVIRAITVSETYFFRDLTQLNAIRQHVLDKLINERRQSGQRYLRLWSAGCSSGEEPYTLAMMLREMLADFDQWHITILGTDVSISNLERAQNGHYRPWSFRSETPLDVSHRWFTEVQEGYQIDPTITSMVTFAPLNLAHGDYPSYASNTTEMDLILCRNVLIYFSRPGVTAVLERLHRALRPDGWLVLGPAEALPSDDSGFTPYSFENAILFQKQFVEEYPDNSVYSAYEIHKPDLTQKSITSYTGNSILESIPSPPQADSWELALSAANKERWTEALSWLADAEAKHQLLPQIHYLRGIIEIHQAETDKALASLRRAIYCDPDFVLAYYALGDLYHSEGKFGKAASQWQQAQVILRTAQPQAIIPFSNDLTVEMLSRLLQFRLDNLPIKN